MVVGTMIPIPKVKCLICISDNFRAITLSSVLGKLFDLIIVDKRMKPYILLIYNLDLKLGYLSLNVQMFL